MKKKVALTKLSLLVVLCLLLCGKAAAEPVVIGFGNPFATEKQQLVEALIQEFNQQHPDIQVVNLPLGPSSVYDDKLRILFVSGQPPHVVWGTGGNLAAYIDQGAMVPIDQFLADDPEMSKDYFLPALIAELTMPDGRLVGLPFENSNTALYYYKDVFDENALMYPDLYWEQGRWNWETFAEACKKVTTDRNHDGIPDLFGFRITTEAYSTFMPFLWQNGGQFYNDDFTRSLIDRVEAIEALEFLADLAHVSQTALVGGNFERREVVMMSGVSLDVPSFERLGTVGTSPLPEGVMKATKSTAKAIGISRTTPEEMEAAWTFMKWLLADERFIEHWLIPAGYLPVTPSGIGYPAYVDYITQHPLIHAFIRQVDYAFNTPILPHPDLAHRELDEVLKQVLLRREVSPAEGLRELARVVNSRIEQYWQQQ
ncbi:MAG TPA: extracellular solute-binding protein [Firmicutes bacterium]|nr:extracellular solute-binding protein [Bacillota bacterium]